LSVNRLIKGHGKKELPRIAKNFGSYSRRDEARISWDQKTSKMEQSFFSEALRSYVEMGQSRVL